MTAFDEARDANIQHNKEILAALGLGSAVQSMMPFKPRVQKSRQKKPARPPKRKEAPSEATSEDENEPARKAARVEESINTDGGSLRRSARNATKRVNYSEDRDNIATTRGLPKMISRAARVEADSEPRSTMQRVHNP